MNRESFLETVLKSYAEQVREAFVECEHENGQVDFKTLNTKLMKLMKGAKAEGLSEQEYLQLVHGELTDVWDKLDFAQGVQFLHAGKKKAA